MMKKLIAFTGRARSGKDTAAELLDRIEIENGNVLSYFAFADTLKNISHNALRLTSEEADILKVLPSAKIANGLSLREFYNTLGDAIKAHFGDDAWNQIVFKDLKEMIPLVDIVVCTDLRYPIEERDMRAFCEEAGIDLIIIKMNNLNHTQRTEHLSAGEHASEYLVDQINEDYTITAHSVEEIKEQLLEILKEEYESAA